MKENKKPIMSIIFLIFVGISAICTIYVFVGNIDADVEGSGGGISFIVLTAFSWVLDLIFLPVGLAGLKKYNKNKK